jgi:hypothetical protein
MALSHEGQALVETLAETMTTFSLERIPEILPLIMQQVNVYKHLSLKQKKIMVIKMLQHLIDVTDCPGDDAIWDPIMKQLLPGMIDLLVESNRGKLVLRKSKSLWARLMPCCHKESSPDDNISQSSNAEPVSAATIKEPEPEPKTVISGSTQESVSL